MDQLTLQQTNEIHRNLERAEDMAQRADAGHGKVFDGNALIALNCLIDAVTILADAVAPKTGPISIAEELDRR